MFLLLGKGIDVLAALLESGPPFFFGEERPTERPPSWSPRKYDSLRLRSPPSSHLRTLELGNPMATDYPGVGTSVRRDLPMEGYPESTHLGTWDNVRDKVREMGCSLSGVPMSKT